jgi:ATP-binding cassette, subfamily C, bacterial
VTALLPVASGRRTRDVVLGLVAGHRTLAATAVGALALSTGASLATAPLLGSVVDLATAGDVDAITSRVVLLAVAALVQAALAFVGLVAVARLGGQVLATLRERFVASALALPLDRIERGGSGDLTSRVTEDVALVGDAVRTAVPNVVRSVLVIALTVVGLGALDWRFALAALLALPVQIGTTRWYLRRSAPLYAAQRVAAGSEQQQLLESIGGAPTVRAFGMADGHLGLLRARVDRSVDLTTTLTVLQTRFFGRLNLAELIGLAAVLSTGYLLVSTGAATVGTASAAALYFVSLFEPVNLVLFLLDSLQAATASVARLVGVVDTGTPDEEQEPAGPAPRDGAIEVRDLRHEYVPGHPVLHGVDLSVSAGTTVALVGTSGGGKTTMAALLAGLRAPSHGTVLVGGAEPARLRPEQLGRTVVLVTQEVHVFAGPLLEDLRLCAPDLPEVAALAALERVGAAAWVAELPDGVHTTVGDGGHELTPERAQQLALARVLVADPLVAVLDEATAEAGSSGARTLDTAAAAALAGRTGILVAHRLTQAATADLVLVMHAGRVVERGSHAGLLARDGRYAQLWAAWRSGRDPA